MKKMSLMTMALAMVVMFMGNDAKAVNLPAGSEPTEEAMGNESDYSINMESSLMLQVNETFTLDPMVIPTTAQTTITWYSEDDIVAKVSSTGVVTAQSVGTTEITARAANGDLWVGSYRVTSNVIRNHVSEYNYPNNFTVTIKEVDGAYYVTELVGMDLTKSIYEGLRINVLDERRAEIDLSFTNDLGNRSMSGCYLECMYLISPNEDYELGYLEEGKIGMTRKADGTLAIDDFYVFAFGLVSNFELAVDAAYHGVETMNMSSATESSSVPTIALDDATPCSLEIYNLNGMLVFSGNEDSKHELAPGTYVFRQGDSAKKITVR